MLPHGKPFHGSRPQNKARFPTAHLPSPAPGSPHTPPRLMGQTLPTLVPGLHCSLCLGGPCVQPLGATPTLYPWFKCPHPPRTGQTNSCLSSGPHGAQAAPTPSGQILHFHGRKVLCVESGPLSSAPDTGVCVAVCACVCACARLGVADHVCVPGRVTECFRVVAGICPLCVWAYIVRCRFFQKLTLRTDSGVTCLFGG